MGGLPKLMDFFQIPPLFGDKVRDARQKADAVRAGNF
jgi:hypothetical protein